LKAAPGTPKALVTPHFSITSTAAIAAFIFAIASLLGGCGTDGLTGWSGVGPTIGTPDAVICVVPHRHRPQGSANLI
jgi:hypothetical protein